MMGEGQSPLDESCSSQGLCEHLWTWYLAQGYLISALKGL